MNYSTFSNNILASFTDGKAGTLTELVYTIFTLPDLMYRIEVPGSLHMSATAIGEGMLLQYVTVCILVSLVLYCYW